MLCTPPGPHFLAILVLISAQHQPLLKQPPLCSPRTQNHKHTLPHCSVSWAGDGKHLAIGTATNTVQLWDVARGKQLRNLRGHAGRVSSLAWNGATLTSAGRDTAILNHDVRVREHVVSTFKGHDQEVCSLKWSSAGQLARCACAPPSAPVLALLAAADLPCKPAPCACACCGLLLLTPHPASACNDRAPGCRLARPHSAANRHQPTPIPPPPTQTPGAAAATTTRSASGTWPTARPGTS